MRNSLVITALFVVAVATLAYVAERGIQSSAPKLAAGDKAPEFTLASVNGTTFDLNSYLGKSDVLLFFNEGLTCSPCLQQMVDIDSSYSTFNGMGLTVVSLTANSAADMKTWAQNNGIARMLVLSDESLQVDKAYDTLFAGSMHAGTAPGHTFILVGRDGSILWRKDYGVYTMYVPMNELIATTRSALK